MATPRSRRLLITLAVPPVVAVYAIHRGLSYLETRYPALPVNDSTCSLALRTPDSPSSQFCAYTDIYAARIPVKSLLSRITKANNQNTTTTTTTTLLSTAWAQAVLGSRILRLEGSLIGLAKNRKFQPGDTGDSPGGLTPLLDSGAPRELLNGALVVRRAPAPENPYGLLVSWKAADEQRELFEKISRWGYPYRLMSGGQHEMSVSEPFAVAGREDEGPYVEVRFSSTHNYEIFPEEGGLAEQKVIPAWVIRLHRGFARLILATAVWELGGELRG